MKFNFKKISAVATGALMTVMTLGVANAASYPAPFVENGVADAAIVYGSQLDAVAFGNVQTSLASYVDGTTTTTAGDVKLTENELVLGLSVANGDISSTIEDNKLETLKDDKLSWDDGLGSEDYNYHEEITIGTSNILTTIDDKELDGVALTNEQALEYKLVFDDALNTTGVGNSEADTLYLEIMGEEYEIEAATATSITVTTSDEVSMSIGDTYTTKDGKVVTLIDVFESSVEVSVDGVSETISTTEKVNGIRINVDTIGYHSNTPETSRAVLKIGKDISKTYTSGDEFIGQDEDDPLWIWDISSLSSADGYIGVKYNAKIDSANDEIAGDSIKYVGEGYTFPNNYAALTLDSITDATYKDLKVYFEESEDLFAASDSSAALIENAPVLVIEADTTDAITVAGHETDKMYVYYNTTNGVFQTFYRDHDGDYTPTAKMRAANLSSGTVGASGLTSTELATLEYGDTNLDFDISVASNVSYLTITNDDFGNNNVAVLKIGGTAISPTTGTLEYLGSTQDDAESADVTFNGTAVGTEEYDYMDHYGIYLSKDTMVKTETDSDEVTLSIPEEQVYAKATVSMGAITTTTGALGDILVKDSDINNVKDMNLVIVGGSCINSAAATVLGGAYCGEAFTTATGVANGEFLIKGVQDAFATGKLALVVAGYEAADTAAAVTYLTKKDNVDTSKTYKGTSATEATVLVE